jgi:hypothetical protein
LLPAVAFLLPAFLYQEKQGGKKRKEIVNELDFSDIRSQIQKSFAIITGVFLLPVVFGEEIPIYKFTGLGRKVFYSA